MALIRCALANTSARFIQDKAEKICAQSGDAFWLEISLQITKNLAVCSVEECNLK